MGEILSYNCRCGYKKTLNAGKGMRSFSSTNLACLCAFCRELITVEIDDNTPKDKALCPRCGRRVMFFNPQGGIPCPKCGLKNDLLTAGRWD